MTSAATCTVPPDYKRQTLVQDMYLVERLLCNTHLQVMPIPSSIPRAAVKVRGLARGMPHSRAGSGSKPMYREPFVDSTAFPPTSGLSTAVSLQPVLPLSFWPHHEPSAVLGAAGSRPRLREGTASSSPARRGGNPSHWRGQTSARRRRGASAPARPAAPPGDPPATPHPSIAS